MAQFLLNTDGSVPHGANIDALIAAGVRFVIPTTPPTVSAGQIAVDTADPEERDGKWYQRWRIDEVEPDPAHRTLTPLEFLRRVPLETRVRIQSAADANPLVKQVLLELQLALEIDLDNADTIAGVGAMVAYGVITQSEADALLA